MTITFDVPPGACDCHTHVFGDSRRFPLAPARSYTPGPASVNELRALHRSLQTDRVVIVQPSVYGADNTCTLDAIRQLGPRARGIALIGHEVPRAELERLARAGIRGVRVNLETDGETDPAVAGSRFDAAVARIEGLNWHVQIYTRPSVIERLHDRVAASPAPIVFDHFGGAQAALGAGQPGFDALLDLVRAGKAYVKMSAPYRSSTRTPDYTDVAPLATALVAANPQRVLWGTDWPHPNAPQPVAPKAADIAPRYSVDAMRVFNQLAVWAPDAAHRKAILVDNPKTLYGF
jgi:predicted TIM-barrel fold metal-dependent hydrolase